VDGLAIDLDPGFARVDLGAELLDHLAIDGHSPLPNDVFTGSSRPDARMSKDLLQPFLARDRFLACLGIGRLAPMRG